MGYAESADAFGFSRAEENKAVKVDAPHGSPRQFEIWWVSLPDPVGRRPVLLLGRTASYAYLSRVVAVEVTTTVRGIPQEVLLGRKEGFSKRCVANLDAVRTVPLSSLKARAGRLGANRYVEVKRALGHVLHWPELTSL